MGAQAKRKRWTEVFAMFQRPLGYEIRDLSSILGDDVAIAHEQVSVPVEPATGKASMNLEP